MPKQSDGGKYGKKNLYSRIRCPRREKKQKQKKEQFICEKIYSKALEESLCSRVAEDAQHQEIKQINMQIFIARNCKAKVEIDAEAEGL
jgi:hypothetical protein